MKKENWEKIDNEICDILRDCGDGHIDGHEEILELFKKEKKKWFKELKLKERIETASALERLDEKLEYITRSL